MDTIEYATIRLKWKTGLTVQDALSRIKIEFALDMVRRSIDVYVWYELYYYTYNMLYLYMKLEQQ